MTTLAPIVGVLISCATDMNSYRDIGEDALRDLARMFTYNLATVISFVDWDYRRDSPTVVATGDLPARSIEIAGRSDVLIGILGSAFGAITCDEIREAARRKADGDSVALLIFAHKKVSPDYRAFLSQISDEFGVEVVWTSFATQLEFQSRLIMSLIPFALSEAGVRVSSAGAA